MGEKFKKGDEVYCNTNGVRGYVSDKNGDYYIILLKSKPYIINDIKKSNVEDNKYYISIKTKDGILLKPEEYSYNIFFEKVDFLTKEEYLNNIKSNGNRNFKAGDIVHYNGSGDLVSKHIKFKLYKNQNPELFDVYNIENKTFFKTFFSKFINKNFISEQEYNSTNNNNNNNNILLDNDDKKNSIKTGDIVYYIGDKIKRFENDKPYIVQFFNPLTGILKIDGDIYPGDDFLTSEQYKVYKSKGDDFNFEMPNNKGQEKTEINIKLQIFYDTKNNKLKWSIPYPSIENWFRTKVLIEQLKDSFLRIDLYKGNAYNNSEWQLKIYYHRKKDNLCGETVKIYKQSAILLKLAELIRKQIRNDDENQYKLDLK